MLTWIDVPSTLLDGDGVVMSAASAVWRCVTAIEERTLWSVDPFAGLSPNFSHFAFWQSFRLRSKESLPVRQFLQTVVG